LKLTGILGGIIPFSTTYDYELLNKRAWVHGTRRAA
jgi:hypothetical protein